MLENSLWIRFFSGHKDSENTGELVGNPKLKIVIYFVLFSKHGCRTPCGLGTVF